MTETTTIAARGAASDAVRSEAAFSYCCECGTYDAHTTMCTCCGFDFRSEGDADEAD